jgi:GTPase
MVEGELVIPYTRQGRISEVYENARVLSEAFDENGRRLKLRALPAALARLTRAFET